MAGQYQIRTTLRASVPALSAILDAHQDKSRNAVGRIVCAAFVSCAPSHTAGQLCEGAAGFGGGRPHHTARAAVRTADHRSATAGASGSSAGCYARHGGAVKGLAIALVISRQDRAIWSTLMDREHPRGVTTFAGAQRRYLISSRHGILAAVGFSARRGISSPGPAYVNTSVTRLKNERILDLALGRKEGDLRRRASVCRSSLVRVRGVHT